MTTAAATMMPIEIIVSVNIGEIFSGYRIEIVTKLFSIENPSVSDGIMMMSVSQTPSVFVKIAERMMRCELHAFLAWVEKSKDMSSCNAVKRCRCSSNQLSFYIL